MFSRMHKRLTYANIAMTVVLVFAMSGGALAASKYLITSTKQISPKVLKQLKGKAGPAGAAGATGAQGPQGPGGNGQNGTPGANGENVTAKAVPSKIAACKDRVAANSRSAAERRCLPATEKRAPTEIASRSNRSRPAKAAANRVAANSRSAAERRYPRATAPRGPLAEHCPRKPPRRERGRSSAQRRKPENPSSTASPEIPLKASIEEEDVGFFGFFGPTPTESTECPGGFPKPGAISGHWTSLRR